MNKSADKNKVRFGISNMHIAPFKKTVADGEIPWEKPIPIPGIVSFKPEPQSEEYSFYADNMAYFSTYSQGSYAGTIETALIPDDILALLFGWDIDEAGGILEKLGGVKRDFALLGQIEGDESGRRYVYYNSTASIPSEEAETVQKAISVKPQSLKITMNPYKFTNDLVATRYALARDSEKPANIAVYDSFFNEVYTPGVTWAQG